METLNVEKKNLYNPVISEILKVESLTATEKRFEIALPKSAMLNHKPGQFVEVSIFGFGEAPISICSSPTRTPTFELTVRKTGRLTDKMHELKAGNALGIRGPFGNGFDIEKFKGKDILYVAGGIGLAPLKSLIDYTIDKRNDFKRIIILYGTKNPAEILFPKEIEEWKKRSDIEFYITVDRPDDKWKGNVGVITTLIPPLELDVENTIVSVVGPPIMYKFVIMSLKGKRIPDENIYLSLERRMKCGVGKCGHCQINGSYVCQEGPVYHYPRCKELEEAI
ncbi:MAG: FAD/NAD(P)-binding protein [Calditrichaceae bacterium]|nr:FAD/NAD(P)-binding protein [Calditrichaceae bacterium]MBN2709625.1 FAD/NAD(P)-binding protein [Calditrichaceae bacterium]RQV92421.1 MAG: oxidoreductase [Calditrichota bacterium]